MNLTNDPIYAVGFGWTITCSYEDLNTLTGNLNLTELDEVDHIVSGLFEFTTVVSGCDTIKVTDGRFDLLYAN